MTIEIKEMTPEDLKQMVAEHKALNPDLHVRPDIKSALEAYAYRGHPLGGFLTAVVENNLFEALGRADSYNRATIFQITQFIYNELPSTCWGSTEIVKAHYLSFEPEGAA